MPRLIRLGAAGGLALALAAAPLVAGAASASPAGVAAAPDPLQLAVVYPLTTPPDAVGLLDAAALERYTGPVGLLTRQLDAVIGQPVAIGIDPRLIASVRVLGDRAPASATAWLDRLTAAPNDTFPLEYADADPAVLAAADALDRRTPTDFDFAIDPDDFGPPATESPVPAAPADPAAADPGDGDGTGTAAPPLPVGDDLLDWDYTLPAIAWPADGTLAPGSVDDLAAAGFAQVLVDESQAPDADAARVDLGDQAGIDGLVSNSELSTTARQIVHADSPAAAAAAGAALQVDLAAAAAARPGATAIVTIDRSWPLGTLYIDQLLAAVRLSPAADPVRLAQVIAGPVDAVELGDPTVDTAGRMTHVSRLIEAADDEERFATVADEPGELLAPRRLALLALLAVGWQATDLDWTSAVDAELDLSDEIVSAVQVVRGSDLLVLSNSTGLPITVSNDLEVPVTVEITARPLRPLLRIDPAPIELAIEPGASNTVYIQAQAVTNGEVPVRVSLRSPDGVQIGDRRIVTVDLQAQWETVGIVVGIVLAVVFAAGIARNIVRRRRQNRRDDADDSAGTDPAGTDPDAADA